MASSQSTAFMVQSPGIYADNLCEVIAIRKLLMMLLCAVFLLMAAPGAEAASHDSKAGAVTTSGGQLNVRREASSGAAVVASLKKGSYVTLIGKSGSWWKVEYDKDRYGYCHSDYITVVQGTPVTVTTRSGSLNVRSGAGTSYPKTASLPKGETVLFLKTQGGWSRILYHGTKTGYVSAQYLSNYFGSVSINVPDYKQTDPRWANVIIGESGKTFSQIGCATTAIAMMESVRTGIKILPDAMAQKLRYTAAGNVYWPADYRVVTNKSGYLSAVYNKLKQGKPVLFGAINSYGSQHWVVITGYSGGTSLDPSGFLIRDPGTYSRTNLQQFFAAYPNFYKYFYY